MKFEELDLCQPLLRAVRETGYTQPSPIQQKAIPPVLSGRDLLGCAQTGTGKTAAFALPILQRLAAPGQRQPGKRPIRALVLTPTRELALQIAESFGAYGKHLPLKCTVIFGGVGQGPQVAQLKSGVDILVATPGRLNDLIGQGHIKLDKLEVFVLDEADRMLDMGFVQDVKKIIRQIPKKRQTLLFSATMPKEIVQLADSLLADPVRIFVTPPATTVERIEQSVYKVDKTNKKHLLARLLKDEAVASALVFTRTKHGADRVVRELSKEGIRAMAIHGNKSQNARQDALARFKNGQVQVLVATDIAARGLDINELSHVINYDLPNIPETYVHRIGRTGRAGHAGIAVSFCDGEEQEYLADIEKLIGFSVPCVQDHPWPMGQASASVNKQEQQIKSARNGPKDRKNAANTENGAKARVPARAPAGRADVPDGRGLKRPDGKPASKQDAQGRAKGRRPMEPRDRARMQPQPEGAPGARTIVTRPPVWGGAGTQGPQDVQAIYAKQTQANPKGEEDMGRNNRRRRGGKGHGAKHQAQPAEKTVSIPKNEKGLFDFSEEELAEDQSLKLISGQDQTHNTENKYASFEDYLKDRG